MQQMKEAKHTVVFSFVANIKILWFIIEEMEYFPFVFTVLLTAISNGEYMFALYWNYIRFHVHAKHTFTLKVDVT